MAIGSTRKILHWPLAGVNRRAAFQDGVDRQREVYATPWAVNVRPQDVFTRRFRGGSRPGLAAGGLPVPPLPVAVSGNSATVYNAATQTYSLVRAVKGTMPSAFTLGASYRGRVLLVGGRAIYASRQGDFTDWDYGADVEDTGRATAFQLSEAAEYGGVVTALIPHKDAYLLAATAGGLWHISGDPVTGNLHNLSRNTGIIGANAWTKIEDTIVFMAIDGLYSVPTSGGDPKNLSREKIPDELRNLQGPDVLLAYNDDEKGIYIFVQGATYQWFYDLVAGGFWPMTLATVPNQAAVVDGVLRLGHNGTPMTVGAAESITSHVLLGPLRLAVPGTFGRVLNFSGTIAVDSGSVDWYMVVGDSAEEAAENGKAAIGGVTTYVAASGTFVAGQSHLTYPRVRSPWMVVWLSGDRRLGIRIMAMEMTQSGDGDNLHFTRSLSCLRAHIQRVFKSAASFSTVPSASRPTMPTPTAMRRRRSLWRRASPRRNVGQRHWHYGSRYCDRRNAARLGCHAVVDVYDANGVLYAYGVTATMMADAFALASGNNITDYPDSATAMILCKRQQVNVDIDGDNASLVGIQSTVIGHADFQDSSSNNIRSLSLAAAEADCWDSDKSVNPYTGAVISKVLVSNGTTTAGTLQIAVLQDATP